MYFKHAVCTAVQVSQMCLFSHGLVAIIIKRSMHKGSFHTMWPCISELVTTTWWGYRPISVPSSMVISDQSMTVCLATVPGHCSKNFCKLAMLQCCRLLNNMLAANLWFCIMRFSRCPWCLQNMFVFDHVPVPWQVALCRCVTCARRACALSVCVQLLRSCSS